MGFSLKKVVKSVAPAVIGTFTGGTAGALAGASGDTSFGGLSGFDFVRGAVGLGQDELNAQRQLAYSKEASDYAFQKNLEMWNLNNAYNDPSAQMARLKAARLNPNLVYGGGNVAGNTSGSTPSYDTPKVSYENKQIQREQLALALREHQQQVTNQAIENDLARQRLVLAEREANRSDALAAAQIRAYEANLGMIDANIGNIGFSQSQRGKEFAYKQYKADLDAWQARYDAHYNKFEARLRPVEAVRRANAAAGRRPMLMDYLNR